MTINVDMRTRLNLPYAQAVQKTTDALKAEGFGVLAQTNMQTAVKRSPDMDFRRHVILGACNPPLAHHALSMGLDVKFPLPCNVTVYEEEDGSVVTAVDPLEMFGVIKEDPVTHEVAVEAKTRLQRMIASLKPSG
jgi:uncharacterized protein (DUF302 family)